jgi:hypothetical protein
MNINSTFNTIKQPFINVDFYKESIHKSFFKSFAILSIIIIAMSFLSSYKFVSNTVPSFIDNTTNTASELSNNYPDDLTFNWNGQKLLSNAENISVPWPSFFRSESKELVEFPNDFLYFHSSNQTPSDLDINLNDFLFVLNSSNIYYKNNSESSQWTEKSLEKLMPPESTFSLNKDSVVFLSNQTLDFISSNTSQIKIVFFAVSSILFYFGNLWFLVIESLLTLLLVKLYSLKLSVKQTFLLTVHIMVPTILLNTVAEMLYGTISFPLQTLTFWILLMFIIFQFKSESESKTK